jgi:hypothetical protein
MVNEAKTLSWGFLCMVCLSACLDVAEERARVDARVGKAESSGLTVQVSRGAAAVRKLTPDALQLWAAAPSLDISVNAAAATRLQLRLQNAMPDGILVASHNNSPIRSRSMRLSARQPRTSPTASTCRPAKLRCASPCRIQASRNPSVMRRSQTCRRLSTRSKTSTAA